MELPLEQLEHLMESNMSTSGQSSSSMGSSPRRLSIHPSVTWGGQDSDTESLRQPPSPAGQPLKPTIKLPGLLSKAGRLCSSHKQLVRMADSYDEARSRQVEDQINYDHLRKLEHMFHEADIDGGGGLDMEEFRKAMKKIMGDISDEDVDVIFMKVDTNCDGSVDWEEYLNYMLREYRGKDDMLKSEFVLEFQATMKPVPVAHAEEIVKIQFYPNQSRFERPRKGRPSGRFLTVSRDGILHYWSDSFKMLRTVYLDQTKRRQSLKLWVIDMLCLPNINLLAIASTDQDIEFFDIGGNKCDRLFALVDLDGCATAMDYWTDGHKGVFCVGDVKGNVLIFTSTDVVMNGLFNVRSYIGGLARVPVQILLKGKSETYKNFSVSGLHGDWCQQITYIPQLNLVASCAPAEESAMALTSLPLHNIGKTQSAVIVLKKGILCFDYASEMNILVTGGFEPLIHVWNPYVTSSPITQMKGHATAVTHIMVNSLRETIVSISKDKNIRIWDLLDHFCLQSIHGRNVPLGNFPISAAYYHRRSNILVCATYTIGLFFGAESLDIDLKSQEQPLCCALYNKYFKQAVSGTYSGSICVWDIMTGQKLMEFTTAKGQPVEITAMIFDPPQRRLITTLKNRTIKLWNFNNGACLMELPVANKGEISCVTYVDRKIFVSGWSRRVTWYLDTKEEGKVIECKHWKSYHAEDILCMDSHSNKLLVTASCNGDIVLWSISSGQAFCRFNASESPLMLLPKREFSVSMDNLGLSPKKGTGYLGKSARRCEACGIAGLWRSRATLPSRPFSANVSASPALHRSQLCSVHGHRPAQPVAEGAWCLVKGEKGYYWPPAEEVAPETSRQRRNAWGSLGSETSDHLPASLDRASEAKMSKKDVPTWQEEVDSFQVAVENVIFLNAREREPNTAILLSSTSDGFVYAWALGSKGGMMGKFRGAHGDVREIAVTAMSTDEKDLVLFTGDTLGYVKIWDIMNYCRPVEAKDTTSESSEEDAPANIFCELIPEYCRFYPTCATPEAAESVLNGWVTTLVPPPCLSSWRGHLKKVVSVQYVERFRAVLTASHDCTVKLWLLTGRHIGTFGESLWNLEMQQLVTAEVPEDLRRMASLHTLRVLNEGRRPHWESTRSIVQSLSQQKRQQSLLMDFLHVKPGTSGDAAGKMQDLILKETRMANYTDEQVEATFQKWEEFGKKKSNILGRAYKQKVRRPLLQQLPEMKANVANKDQTRIYHCIQYTELQQVASPHVPELLKEAQQNQAAVEQRTVKKGKRWLTLSGVVKPTLKSYMRRKQTQHTKE